VYNSLPHILGLGDKVMPKLPNITFEECDISPNDIDLSKELEDTFGKFEIEESALIVLKFFQSKGNWEPFTREEFMPWYWRSGYTKSFNFEALIREAWDEPGWYGGYLLLDNGVEIYPTIRLVEKAYKRHPVQRIPME
jgi:hypothetical protein